MKKVFLFITTLYLVFPLVSSAEILKIYPSSDAVGQLYDDDQILNWSTARNFQGPIFRTPFESGVLDNEGKIFVRSDNASGYYRIYRVSNIFDLSNVPASATITNAVLKLYKTSPNNQGDVSLVVTSHNRGNSGIFQKEDWRINTFGTLEFSRGGLVDGIYSSFNFNNVGIDYLNNHNVVDLGILTSYDFDNTTPPSGISAAGWYESEMNGTSFDPYLEVTYSIPDENPYSLYTQIVSSHPSVPETTSWANDTYASGKGAIGSYPCGLTIAQCGCALTSLIMTARNVGINQSIIGDNVDPGNLNSYLDSVGGYDSEGGLYWLKAQAYFGRLNSEGKIESRLLSTKQVSTGVMSAIDAALATPGKAVLGYKNGHFVWLPAKNGADYLVRDPYWYDTQTANDSAVPNLVRDYNNNFDSARIITIGNLPAVLSGIEAHLISKTAELLFRNTAGRKVGYENGSVFIDLENASYGNTEVVRLDGNIVPSGNKSLLVYNTDNTFSIDVVGKGFGVFTLEFLAITETGETKTFTLSGSTIPGITTTFNFNLSTGIVTEQPISYNQFLDILNREMAGYTDQQKAFFLKWADKIYANMEIKTVTQAIKSIEVYQKLLVAKKIDSPVLFAVTDVLKTQVKR